ncbi:hypothetical protein LE181_17705 [Streptomyces sp. SCA3-4]|uniref:hypothetical protein n=1 Tax=Streptomyces sichuanensis TaxID=2871810 RepID=UPI001CE298A5|nr:hypothetical protein [Streptomyces sichuanensis]MCA6093987.1 hypothetical protein [Streptomyces sichuanensis]
MHMNSAPHLLAEDRPEFERVLDRALRSADRDPEISALAAAIGQRLNTEQLRTMALSATAAISACAAPEYEDFVSAREELRARSAAARPQPVGRAVTHAAPPGDEDPGTGADPVAPPGDDPGAGAGAVLAVLAPVLAGIAAFLFLLIGYVMRTVGSNEAVADQMIKVGWWFGGFTVAGVLIAMSGMLRTALRNGRRPEDGLPADRLTEEAEQAREAWRQALLDRGIMPFLREALANAPAGSRPSSVRRQAPGSGRTPPLGYSRPGFSSPDDGPSPSTRAGFTSPDFSSPDFGGPDHRPE